MGVGGLGSDASEALDLMTSGDVCTLREREAKRGGPGRGYGGDKWVADSTMGVGGGRGVAGVTENWTPDSGRQGRGRIEGLRERWWGGAGGADLGVGGIGILGRGRIFWPRSAN